MRVLVTGGAGFLGSHLCDRLVADGHDVVCVDDLSTGRRRNIEPLLAGGRFRFLQADVVDPPPLEGPLDRVFHLACPVGAAHYAGRPIATLRASGEGARRCLDLAAECGATFVLASTSEVYGDPEVHPQVETYPGRVSPVGPRSAYTEGKRFAEALAVAYGRERGVRVRIARIFNTYGPRARPDDGRVVSNFIVRALAGRPLAVHGDGRQTRSFCYSSDMVEALLRLAEAGAEADGKPVNLGNPEEVSILDLAREILDLAGSKARIEFAPMMPEDPVRRRPDITRARQLLNWQPRVTRRQGLTATIRYYREEEPTP